MWHTNPSLCYIRTPQRHIVIHFPGVQSVAKNGKTIEKTKSLLGNFFSQRWLTRNYHFYQYIFKTKIRDDYQSGKDVLDTDVDEIRALFGILYITGMLRSNNINLSVGKKWIYSRYLLCRNV